MYFVRKDEMKCVLGLHVIAMPEGARVIRVALRNDYIELWAIVTTTQKIETRMFHVVESESSLSKVDMTKYLGSVSIGPNALTLHIFED